MNTALLVFLMTAQAGPSNTAAQSRGGTDAPSPDAPPQRDAPPPVLEAPAPAPRDEVARPAGRRTSGGAHIVQVFRDQSGFKLQSDGKDVFVFGMNWTYVPPGTNYNYSLWTQPDAFIKEALDYEMKLLSGMGVNVIRQYVGIPKKWIEYIYDNYGIYTVVNHAMGRYGFQIDGNYVAPTNYQDPRTRELIRDDIVAMVEELKDTRGLLFWLLGNENNYGLEWSSFEIEDLPLEQRNNEKAKHLYTLFGDVVDAIHAVDSNHPVAIANGDLQYIDLIKEHVPNLDILGSNVYRGYTSGGLFKEVQDVLDVPFVYTEFGADAYNARDKREDHVGQAEYFRTLWQEIYEQSYGKGRVGNAIGGMSFQWSDGWWKYQQEINLDIQDNTASWRNEAYPHDLPDEGNNMNEEWFGIAAKSRTDDEGFFELYPRSSYFLLKRGYELDPYSEETSLEAIREHWGALDPSEYALPYDVSILKNKVDELTLLRVSRLTVDLQTYYTDGALLDLEGNGTLFDPMENRQRQQQRVESTQSLYFGLESRPADGIRAEAQFNVLGNVATNPINELFYEDRVFDVEFFDPAANDFQLIPGNERIAIYNAKVEWDDPWFNLEAFYRTGHYHWGYEGDFFGLRPETYYGQNIDIYQANVPIGVEIEGKKALRGFKLLFGQQVYWGANPLIMGKYETKVGAYDLALIHQEDLAQQQDAAVSAVIPQPKSRKTTLYVARQLNNVKVEVGGILAGSPLIGEDIQRVEDAPDGTTSYLNSGFLVFDDEIRFVDTLGAKGKLTGTFGSVNAYVQGAYKGLVASGGPDATLTYTGWTLKESGQGNQWNVLGGFTARYGNLQIAPNFIYQKPLAEALPNIPGFADPVTGEFFPGITPRNILDDPFSVRGNQEMAAYELMFVWDPTPASFFWQFDNRAQEDSKFALALDLVYRDYRGVQDAGIGVLPNGQQFPFPESVPEEDLFEVNLQARGKVQNTRYAVVAYAGEGQPNGDDERVVTRFGVNYEVSYKNLFVNGFVRIDDWGPYDFHRDFNLTFPLQTMLDISYGATLPSWVYEAYSKIGIRTQWRLLNDESPRFRVDPEVPTQTRLFSNLGDGDNLGYELEVLTYLNITF